LLTNKDGKQEAKDDDEHEVEQHAVFWSRDGVADYLDSLTGDRVSCQGAGGA